MKTAREAAQERQQQAAQLKQESKPQEPNRMSAETVEQLRLRLAELEAKQSR